MSCFRHWVVQTRHNTYQVGHRWERSAVLQENWVKPLDSLFACAAAHKIVGYCLTRKECVGVCNLKPAKQTEQQKGRIIIHLPKPMWAQFSAKAWIWVGQSSTQNNLGKKGNVKLSKNLSQEGSYCQWRFTEHFAFKIVTFRLANHWSWNYITRKSKIRFR